MTQPLEAESLKAWMQGQGRQDVQALQDKIEGREESRQSALRFSGGKNCQGLERDSRPLRRAGLISRLMLWNYSAAEAVTDDLTLAFAFDEI